MTFFGNKPVDWLMYDYINMVSCNPEMRGPDCQAKMAQNKPQCSVGLFQHVGKCSLTKSPIVDIEF